MAQVSITLTQENDHVPKLLNQMHNDLRVNGAATVAQAVHRLRETVVYLGAHPTMDDVHRVEPIGESGDLTGAAEAIQQLRQKTAGLEQTLVPYRQGTDP